MNVKAITFKRGGTIIAELNEDDDNYFLLRPVEAIMSKNESEDFFMTFIPFLHYTEESRTTGIQIPKSEIMNVSTPIEQVVRHYITSFEKRNEPSSENS
jgi:CRISPR/Cas system endoribonuclease Cas6 (RAMP superfamily)